MSLITKEWRKQQPSLPSAGKLLNQIKTEREQQARASGKKLKPIASPAEKEVADLPELPEGWSWVRVSFLGEIETGSTPSKQNPNFYGKDFPFYKPADLEAGYNVKVASDNLSKLGMKEARFLSENSILVTSIGATIGKTGIIRKAGASNQQINAIIPSDALNSNFVYYQAVAPNFQKQIRDNASATTLPIINKSKFENLIVCICSAQEQHQIVEEIESRLSVCDKLEETITASLRQAEALRQSILKKAFEGKLVPQDPKDLPASELQNQIKAEKQMSSAGTSKRQLKATSAGR